MGEEHEDWQFWKEYQLEVKTDLDIASENNTWVDFDQWHKQRQNNNVTLRGGGEEMLRVAEDGFYVRGVRVDADANEAKHVYEAFKQWLTWNTLSSQNN